MSQKLLAEALQALQKTHTKHKSQAVSGNLFVVFMIDQVDFQGLPIQQDSGKPKAALLTNASPALHQQEASCLCMANARC